MMRKPEREPAGIPAPGEGKRGPEGYLGYLLRQGAAAVRLRLERELAELDVTSAQFMVLTMLKAYPGISNADLARLSLLTPQTVHATVANLERAGTIARRDHAVHGRIRQIALTEAGEALLARCKAPSSAREAQLRAGLSPAEERIIRSWLASLAAAE